MKLPYLTASNKGILELLKDGETCITCEPANAKSLANKILWAKNNPQELDRISKKAYEFYVANLTSGVLVKRLLDKIQALK
jgi:glycosyltransferase involved in cell wall biosynthesis